MTRIALSLLFSLAFQLLHAQMWNGTDTLYGNEWIDYGRTYYSIRVAADGLYRIPAPALETAGVPAMQYRLIHQGREVPV